MPTNRLIEKEKIATYARVLFDAAYEAGNQDAVLEVRNQAEQIAGVIRGNMELASALGDSAFSPEQRAGLARSIFAECNPVLVDVLAVMAEQGDAELLPRVWANYEEQLKSKLDLCVVDVTTVVELDDHLREVITSKAEKELGMKVVLRERIDKSILGGIIMSAEGKRIDASLSLQIESAREVLKQS